MPLKERRCAGESVKNDNKIEKILILLGAVGVVWLGLLAAPYWEDNLLRLLMHGNEILARPFHVTVCSASVKVVGVFLLGYGLAIACFQSSRRNYRRREEHGSAQWGSIQVLKRKYSVKPVTENIILTQQVALSFRVREHLRNMNVVVVGGSGSGKTRFYAKPNLMNANTSFVCLDPKG